MLRVGVWTSHTLYNVSSRALLIDCIAHINEVHRPRPFIPGPEDYAQRPLDTKLLLNEKLVSELLCFPHAPKGTTMIVLLSSEPYWRAWEKTITIKFNYTIQAFTVRGCKVTHECLTWSDILWAASLGSWHWLMTLQISWLFIMKLTPSVVSARNESWTWCNWRKGQR